MNLPMKRMILVALLGALPIVASAGNELEVVKQNLIDTRGYTEGQENKNVTEANESNGNIYVQASDKGLTSNTATLNNDTDNGGASVSALGSVGELQDAGQGIDDSELGF